MKRLAIIIFSLLSAAHLWSQSAAISGQVFNQYGQTVAGAQVYICNAATSTGLPCTPPATIYQDFNLTTPIANPTQTDANGNFNVYVGALAFPNVYVVNSVPQAGTVYTQLYNGPYCSLSGCTFSGNITAGIFNATVSPYYEINGVQISSAALSDDSNLAKLNASNVFTGLNQTAPTWTATTQFTGPGTGLTGTAAGLSIGGNAATATAAATIGTQGYVSGNVYLTSVVNQVSSGQLVLALPNVTFASATNALTAPVHNATTGFTIGGAAPLNHVLLGNGTDYVDSPNIPASLISVLYYQNVDTNGTGVAQRSALNFSTDFALSDSASPSETTVSLSTTGISAGPCNNPSSITFDNKGRATSCTGSGGSITVTNCLTTSCVGGTYSSSGGTFTNSAAYSVIEMVTATLAGTSGTGGQYTINSTIAGLTGPASEVANECNSNAPASITFMVPPGATFVVTPTVVSTCSPAGTWAITSWVEGTL